MSVATSVCTLLESLHLDEVGSARAAIAMALANKLDEAERTSSGTIAMATAGIAKELRAVVDQILESQGETEDFVAGLFSGVGDAKDA